MDQRFLKQLTLGLLGAVLIVLGLGFLFSTTVVPPPPLRRVQAVGRPGSVNLTRPGPVGVGDDRPRSSDASFNEPVGDWIGTLNLQIAERATWCGGSSYDISCSEHACALRPHGPNGPWNLARRPVMALELAAVKLGAPAEIDQCQAAEARGPLTIVAPNEPGCFVVGLHGPIESGAARDALCAATRR